MTTDHLTTDGPASQPADGSDDTLERTRNEVAPATHPVEVERLAREVQQHPDCDALSVQVLLWVVRAAAAVLDNQADNLRDLGVSASGFNVLMALRNSPGQVLEPCDIAERLLVSRPSVTGLLDTLENSGLIERRAHPDDKRRRLVYLTATARAMLRDNLSLHYGEIDRLLAGLDRDQRRQLVTLLRQIEGATPTALQ